MGKSFCWNQRPSNANSAPWSCQYPHTCMIADFDLFISQILTIYSVVDLYLGLHGISPVKSSRDSFLNSSSPVITPISCDVYCTLISHHLCTLFSSRLYVYLHEDHMKKINKKNHSRNSKTQWEERSKKCK